MRSPSSATDQSKNSRLSFNFFYFATGDTQKDSGLEIEFMLDTGASSSIINYRNFWEICQTQDTITVKISTTQTKTCSGQVMPMISFATLTFSYDPYGQFSFPSTVWITKKRLRTFSARTSVKNKYLAFTLIYPELNLKSHQILFVMETFKGTNRTLSFRKYSPLEPHMQCTLKPWAQDAGSIRLKILRLTFFLDQLFIQIAMLSLQD